MVITFNIFFMAFNIKMEKKKAQCLSFFLLAKH